MSRVDEPLSSSDWETLLKDVLHERPPFDDSDLPAQIGRYRVGAILGRGGYGVVYLAYDERLQRPVAVKVPYQERLAQPEDVELFLAEARIVAKLEHPHIVPVYDFGPTEDGRCFLVSRFIDGSSLSQRLKCSRPTPHQAAQLIATIADALHFAHLRHIVHRDIKPGNILLSSSDTPYLGDFGVALHDTDFDVAGRYAGTPAYMSPEQACGEGHRVNGQSDIFSLGVVFYEMLTGQRPFFAKTREELLEQIASIVEARPPRQLNDKIPRELERICLKALAKRAIDRYTTAADFAEELRLVNGSVTAFDIRTTPIVPLALAVRVVPKGLHSFDAHDADFFLDLLPGPRNRGGLPECVRFWKQRLEERDAEQTFPVGVLYGPSGCGKTSFIKAGLLPRLASDVTAIYIECSASGTESRLLSSLRKLQPDAHLSLPDAFAALRARKGLASSGKVVVILDQFEQWLHAHQGEADAPLLQALRQCDGGRLQAVLTLRDDFWIAVTRFMHQVEVPLVDGHNCALLDLFDERHARKVLTAFGQAFGAVPESPREISKEQRQFVVRAVAGLAEDGKVISVRLSLFAEMVKGKTWSSATWKQIGGAEGVGVAFLEETFSAATAPPEHRTHAEAARSVLRALLPEQGTDIRGRILSEQQLLEASGYERHPSDFADLLRILDSETRLITPTQAPLIYADDESMPTPAGGERKYYQLTHDYLVPSLREWLTRKQKETPRGRAELLLADRAAVWSARPESRQLPSPLEWLRIRRWTHVKNWTSPQRKMMRKAGQLHMVRGLAAMIVLILFGWAIYEVRNNDRAEQLLTHLLAAEVERVPEIVEEMALYRRWIDPLLKDARDAHENQTADRQMRISLALLPVDKSQKEYLYQRLLKADPQEALVLRDALFPYKNELLGELWSAVAEPPKGQAHPRLCAAAALATFDAKSEQWLISRELIVDDLVTIPAVQLPVWIEAMKPASDKLVPPLCAIFRNSRRSETELVLAASILAEFTTNQPALLAALVMDANEKQFAIVFPKLKDHKLDRSDLLQREINRQPPVDVDQKTRDKQAKRQANAAVALLNWDRPEAAWPLLERRADNTDPRLRSYLIHRLGPLGANPQVLVERLAVETDVTVRRALILSLGEFREDIWSPDDRVAFIGKLKGMYRTDDDPGLHSAAEWLLRQWGEGNWIKEAENTWAKDASWRKWKFDKALSNAKLQNKPQWYINSQGQTMILIRPDDFWMGSTRDEDFHESHERQHRRRIGRLYAIMAKEVTVEQFQKFRKKGYKPDTSPTVDCPMNMVNWFDAAEYCNWLSRLEDEGIKEEQQCYLANEKFEDGMKLPKRFWLRTGHRLPTEAEWEYACRAGAETARYYGETEELLKNYGRYLFSSLGGPMLPVGSLKPNDFGLFDMHGNAIEWCQDRYIDGTDDKYPASPSEDQPIVDDAELENDGYEVIVNDKVKRVLRGGHFADLPKHVRSANRTAYPATYNWDRACFRVARTILVDLTD